VKDFGRIVEAEYQKTITEVREALGFGVARAESLEMALRSEEAIEDLFFGPDKALDVFEIDIPGFSIIELVTNIAANPGRHFQRGSERRARIDRITANWLIGLLYVAGADAILSAISYLVAQVLRAQGVIGSIHPLLVVPIPAWIRSLDPIQQWAVLLAGSLLLGVLLFYAYGVIRALERRHVFSLYYRPKMVVDEDKVTKMLEGYPDLLKHMPANPFDRFDTIIRYGRTVYSELLLLHSSGSSKEDFDILSQLMSGLPASEDLVISFLKSKIHNYRRAASEVVKHSASDAIEVMSGIG
jgi:predicted outer membrane lipoprotein